MFFLSQPLYFFRPLLRRGPDDRPQLQQLQPRVPQGSQRPPGHPRHRLLRLLPLQRRQVQRVLTADTHHEGGDELHIQGAARRI